jgi:hypothetical protein
MIGGATFVMLGWQWARARPAPWLPRKITGFHLNGRLWAGLLDSCRGMLVFCKRFTRPRLQSWVQGARGDLITGSLVITGGLLISIPLPGMLFNNTLPACIILFAAIGWLEKDGFMIVCSAFAVLLSLAYFALIFWAVFALGHGALQWLPSFAS